MFNKSKLFSKDSFYVILFICLCIVAVAAVVISNRNSNNVSKSWVKLQRLRTKKATQPNNEPTLIQEKQNSTAPVSNLPKPVASSIMQSQNQNQSQKQTTNSTNNQIKSKKVDVVLKLAKPIEANIKKPFDDTKPLYNQTLDQWETHEGIDFEADLGTEVKAAEAGKVVKIFKDDKITNTINKTGYGVTVIVDHGNGYQTVYCNLAEDLKVKEGDKVSKGQVIGVVGDTSVRESVAIEGSHLHFMVLKKNGKDYIPVDPQKFLK